MWKLDDSRPIYPQLKEILLRDIITGKYSRGSAFPTVRDLAETAGVNRNTMQRALSELESEGLIITNRTAGRTVTEDGELINRIRADLADRIADRFIDEMMSISVDISEAIAILNTKGERK
ncbi:MAG: GntR family transcriptional regulator [Clostridiales bacterium]|nr:GntR family transcriptional regulator [Clostridiales bacterium]MDD6389398.1 GntR family transcriptional regulator [Bacillota bacterium]MDY5975457.1 GntR family transcriptional regulator [Anaerovoracaceae bacterium]